MPTCCEPEKKYHSIRHLENDGFVRLRTYGNPAMNYAGMIDRFVVYAKLSSGGLVYDFDDEKLRNALLEFAEKAGIANSEKTVFGPRDREINPLKILFNPGEQLAICFEKLESVEYILRF